MSAPVAGSSALLAAPVIGVRPRIGLHLEFDLVDADGKEVGQVTDTFPSLSHLFTQPNTFIVELGSLAGQLRALALTSAVCLEVISVNR